MVNTNQYPIPLYLNQRYVFDILAMMESGFYQLETIKTIQSEQRDKSTRYSGEIGIKNVFAFLGISFNPERITKGQATDSQETMQERVHTPNSLFAKMRERLYQQELITSSKLSDVKSGDFVEFKILLRKNPLIDALETIKSIGQMALIFDEPKSPKRQKGQKMPESTTKKVLEQIDSLLNGLNSDGTFDLIGTSVDETGIKVVLTIDSSFLSNPSLSDLVDGEYAVIGKVTKVISQAGHDKINLLRKTSLGKLDNSLFFEKMKESMEGVQQYGIKLPELITEIKGPAIQLMPIAVFA